MEECEPYKNNINLYNICIGNTSLPNYKVNAYRKTLGLSNLYQDNEQIKNYSFVPPKNETKLSYANIGYGVGTELLFIFKESGVPACQACFKLAKQMNVWGIDKCLENIDFIITDMMPRAKEWISENKPWINRLLPNAIEEIGIKIALESKIKTAIDNFKNKTNKQTLFTHQVKGGCGCNKTKK